MLLGADEACEAIGRAARDVGLEVVRTGESLPEARTAKVAVGASGPSSGPDGAQAVLVADTEAADRGAGLLRGLKERGLPVYHV